jgi:hypothetical protein
MCFHLPRFVCPDRRIMVNQKNFTSPGTITRAAIPENQRIWLSRYRTWQRFHHGVRKPGVPLLKNLSNYPSCVLVAGCQRSGTTMLTRLIAGAVGFSRLSLTTDDELDAALALAGFVDLPKRERYCFQTTYLNERYAEYRSLGPDQRLIWVLRNPYSVVYSMLYNWRRFALNELYEGCGIHSASSARLRRSSLLWPLGPSRIEKACLAYSGKVAQILQIRHLLKPEQLLVIDYDALIASPTDWLPRIFEFAHASFDEASARRVKREPAKKADLLSDRERRQVELLALPMYRECVAMVANHCAI